MVERSIGFLRKRIARAQTRTGTKKFIDILPKLIDGYNKSIHSSTKFKPVDAQLEENQPAVFKNLFKKLIGMKPKRFEFAINDLVRISRSKVTFAKASREEAWSREIFKIYKRYSSYPTNYCYLLLVKSQSTKLFAQWR